MYAQFNRFAIELTKKQAQIGMHQGSCDNDVAYLRTFPKIKRQLDKLDPTALRVELREYGAWSEEELENHDHNFTLILWIACGNIIEGN